MPVWLCSVCSVRLRRTHGRVVSHLCTHAAHLRAADTRVHVRIGVGVLLQPSLPGKILTFSRCCVYVYAYSPEKHPFVLHARPRREIRLLRSTPPGYRAASHFPTPFSLFSHLFSLFFALHVALLSRSHYFPSVSSSLPYFFRFSSPLLLSIRFH